MNRLIPARIHTQIPEISALIIVAAMMTLALLVFQYQRASTLVTHTMAVKSSIAEVFATTLDAESGSRGYIISGDAGFLPPYQRAGARSHAELNQLRQLTIDNADQQRTLALIETEIAERFAVLERSIDLRRAGGLDAVVAVLPILPAPRPMQSIRDNVAIMQAAEDRLYDTRLAAEHWTIAATGTAAVMLLLLVLGAMAAWIRDTRRETETSRRTIIAREQNETQIRQMQKMEAVGQLTGGLAHDLNNMLAVIMSGLTLTQKRLAAGNHDVLRFVDGAMDGAARAASLTGRLMAFSRQLPLRPQSLDANRLVGGMAELVRRTLGETINTQTVLNAGLWSVNVDTGQLENAILNLAINARDAMPDGGKLTMETANTHFDDAYARDNEMPAGQYVMIAVTDTGTGMTADVIGKAFDPFFTTKGVGKGTGLGLSQAFGFIKQSGGHIKIYSEPGHGTTIKMYLPRLYETGPAQEINTANQEAWPGLSKDNARHIVLVVEDDARVNEMTVSSLRELGFTVIHAGNATGALTQLDANPGIEVLFTDIVMPDVNGRQLAAEASRRRPDLKVLYTTGFTRDAIVHSGKLDAGLHFIAKPFTLVQIAAKMQEVLSDVAMPRDVRRPVIPV